MVKRMVVEVCFNIHPVRTGSQNEADSDIAAGISLLTAFAIALQGAWQIHAEFGFGTGLQAGGFEKANVAFQSSREIGTTDLGVGIIVFVASVFGVFQQIQTSEFMACKFIGQVEGSI